MPDVIELLERLAETPPALPRPPDELRTRATHRRRRRQRRRTVAGAAVALATVLVAVLVAVQDDERPGRVSSGPSTTPTSGPPPTLDQSIGGLTVTPFAGLHDGDTVTLTLTSDPGGEIVATQCAAEVLEFTDAEEGDITGAPPEWCGTTYNLRSSAGRPDLTMPVARQQRAGSSDIVDCAEAPGRCVIMVDDPAVSGPPGAVAARFAPLAFAGEPLPTPTIRLVDVDDPVEDGQLVEVEVEGLPANAGVILGQCRGTGRCDLARMGQFTTDSAGRLTTEVRVFHDIWAIAEGGQRGEWTACDPCYMNVLVDLGVTGSDHSVDLPIVPTDDPIRPTLRIAEQGPYAPGQNVTVEGEGFQVGAQVGLGWCPGAGPASCTYSGEWPAVGDDGRFTTEYTLPSGARSADCIATPGLCTIAWGPAQDAEPPLVELPIDLSG